MSEKVENKHRGLNPTQREFVNEFANQLNDVLDFFANPTALNIILALYLEGMLYETEIVQVRKSWREMRIITSKEGGALRHAILRLFKRGILSKDINGKYCLTRWGWNLAKMIIKVCIEIAQDINAPPNLRENAVEILKILQVKEGVLKKYVTSSIS